MSHADQTPRAAPASPGILRFDCPACHQELSIPGSLAGVEGPCPYCRVGIAAPIPASQLPARVLQAQPTVHLTPPQPPSPAARPPAQEAVPVPPVVAPPAPPQRAAALETRHVLCQACGCELAIDPSMAHLPGGPCPRCQTWIDLSGNQSAPAVASAPPEPARPSATGPPQGSEQLHRRASAACSTEQPRLRTQHNGSAFRGRDECPEAGES